MVWYESRDLKEELALATYKWLQVISNIMLVKPVRNYTKQLEYITKDNVYNILKT